MRVSCQTIERSLFSGIMVSLHAKLSLVVHGIYSPSENCSPPLHSQGHAIVNGIRRIAHVFGYVTSFKAYLDISSQSPKSVGFRSDLQSSGVSMTDCPHNGRKDVVDKMILGVYSATSVCTMHYELSSATSGYACICQRPSFACHCYLDSR